MKKTLLLTLLLTSTLASAQETCIMRRLRGKGGQTQKTFSCAKGETIRETSDCVMKFPDVPTRKRLVSSRSVRCEIGMDANFILCDDLGLDLEKDYSCLPSFAIDMLCCKPARKK